MIFSDSDILQAIEDGLIHIDPFDKTKLGPASYDMSLSKEAFHLKPGQTYDTKVRELPLDPFTIEQSGYDVTPGEYLLIKTKERLVLNNSVLGTFGTSGSKAQAGLQVLNGSIFTEPNTDNYIILEVQNISPNNIRIYPGSCLVKVVFSRTITPASNKHTVPAFFKRNHLG